ncbi:SPW repeat protein [Actinacidiphila yeochonensis]|uniref:SPW repeat protein n=1 Tax=Actinacidiphila yeochonensis TaxID=89050 RepID=UPI000A3FD453|nr:SPW repeat protein [Actinacidiphila yeochonensis]
MATHSTHSSTSSAATSPAESSATRVSMEDHPDIVELRNQYQAVSHKPVTGLVEGLCLLTGLYLAISPWVVGFQGTAAIRVSNLICGLALAALALGYGSVLERTHGLGWVAVAIGAWTILAPWVVVGHPHTSHIVWSNSFAGGAAILLGLLTMAMGLMRRRQRTMH